MSSSLDFTFQKTVIQPVTAYGLLLQQRFCLCLHYMTVLSASLFLLASSIQK